MAGCHVQPEQMLQLIWGYNAVVGQSVAKLSTGGVTTDCVSAAVATDEAWVVQITTSRHTDPAARRLQLFVNRGGTIITLLDKTGVVVTESINLNSSFTMVAGDTLTARGVNLVNGCTLYLDYVGYKMKLSQ